MALSSQTPRDSRERGGLGPVIVGKIQLPVAPVLVVAKANDVVLRQANVLQQLPCGVGQACLFAPQTGRKIRHYIFKAGVGVAALEPCNQFLPECGIRVTYQFSTCHLKPSTEVDS